MRDPKRIPTVLHEIQRVWEAYPDMRLGQLLINCVSDLTLFYIEDEELVHELLEMSYNDAKESINGKA